MKIVHMTRCSPEVEGGPVDIDIQEQDVAILESRGWVKKDEDASVKEKSSKPKEKSVTSSEKTEDDDEIGTKAKKGK